MPVREIFKMDFLEEKVFDREQYDTYIRRIHYDDRDAVMYEKMIHFFFPYIVEERGIEDRVGLMEEYIHWNEQLIKKCLYHLPHFRLLIHKSFLQPYHS